MTFWKREIKNKVNWNIVNSCLVIAIIAIVFLKFYKKEISCNCEYNNIPVHILPILEKITPPANQRLKAIMVFNEIPKLKDMEMMSKIYKKYRSQADLVALFLKRFKQKNSFEFPYRFLANKQIHCHGNGVVFDKNFFILLNEDKVKFVDFIPDPQMLALLLNKNLHFAANNNVLQKEELENNLSRKFHQGNINLWNLATQRRESICLTDSATEIHFYHSGCSPCELKRILENAQLNQIQGERPIISIFSFQTNISDLTDVSATRSVLQKVYLDVDDCFDMGFIETRQIENPIIIRKTVSVGDMDETN
jgi:hypothetical protein